MEYSIKFDLNHGLPIRYSFKSQWGDTFNFQKNITLYGLCDAVYALKHRKLKRQKTHKSIYAAEGCLGTMLYFITVQQPKIQTDFLPDYFLVYYKIYFPLKILLGVNLLTLENNCIQDKLLLAKSAPRCSCYDTN